MYFHDIDEIDILYARMQREDPLPDLANRVLTIAAERARRRRRIGILMFVGGLFAATLLAFIVGYGFASTGALDLTLIQLQNFDLLGDAPGEFLMALAENVPWVPLVLGGAALATAWSALPMLTAPIVAARRRDAGL